MKCFLLFSFFILLSNNGFSQDFKFGIDHSLTVNDFVSPNSPAHLKLKEMPRGMELGLNYRLNKMARLSFPFRTGFGKALGDTVGRTFVGLDTRLLIEKHFGKVYPFVSSGIGVQFLSQKWDVGVPIGLGVSIPFDEGFTITLSSNYRRSFVRQHHSWTHGIGLGFRFNPAKFKSNFMAGTPISPVEPKEGDPPMEEFRADDSEQQEGIITPTPFEDTSFGAASDTRVQKGFQRKRLDTLIHTRIALLPLAVFEDPYKAFRINGLLDSSFFSSSKQMDTVLNALGAFATTHGAYTEAISLRKSFKQGAKNQKNGTDEDWNVEKGSLMATLYFEWDVFSLTQASRWMVTEQLEKYAAVNQLWLVGHADNQGSDAYNFELSRKRVESVKNELLKKGIPASKIKVSFYGERNPSQSNDTPQGRKANRRVEIFYQD